MKMHQHINTYLNTMYTEPNTLHMGEIFSIMPGYMMIC